MEDIVPVSSPPTTYVLVSPLGPKLGNDEIFGDCQSAPLPAAGRDCKAPGGDWCWLC